MKPLMLFRENGDVFIRGQSGKYFCQAIPMYEWSYEDLMASNPAKSGKFSIEPSKVAITSTLFVPLVNEVVQLRKELDTACAELARLRVQNRRLLGISKVLMESRGGNKNADIG